ncbi:MAG: hypothetical protein KDD19_02260 [Phaeodactylibacter sp.]|nr:hypothetical protein [Phaeodactylibacter sp.]MCB9048986.1 hypothetical protein [Lewinellaceae bacterium]
MKKLNHSGFLCALFALAFHGPLFGQEGFDGVNSEGELVERVTQRVQEIVSSLEERLANQEPIIDTLALEDGQNEARILKLWMENEKAVKLTVTEPDDNGDMVRQSTFYFGGPDLFFVAQPFSRFIFIKGRLEYWLDEDMNAIPATVELLDEREGLLYDEANRYLGWFFGEK